MNQTENPKENSRKGEIIWLTLLKLEDMDDNPEKNRCLKRALLNNMIRTHFLQGKDDREERREEHVKDFPDEDCVKGISRDLSVYLDSYREQCETSDFEALSNATCYIFMATFLIFLFLIIFC